MLNVSQRIWHNIRDKAHIDKKVIHELKHLFKFYKNNDIIYLSSISRVTSHDINKAAAVLEVLKDYGFIEVNFMYYCFNCQKYNSTIYRTLGELPESIYCEECGRELTFKNNSIMVFRVIKTDV